MSHRNEKYVAADQVQRSASLPDRRQGTLAVLTGQQSTVPFAAFASKSSMLPISLTRLLRPAPPRALSPPRRRTRAAARGRRPAVAVSGAWNSDDHAGALGYLLEDIDWRMPQRTWRRPLPRARRFCCGCDVRHTDIGGDNLEWKHKRQKHTETFHGSRDRHRQASGAGGKAQLFGVV